MVEYHLEGVTILSPIPFC